MSEVARITGTLVEYDEAKKWGWIKYDENKDKIYLDPEQVKDLKLEEDDEVTFTIEINGSEPRAVNVKFSSRPPSA